MVLLLMVQPCQCRICKIRSLFQWKGFYIPIPLLDLSKIFDKQFSICPTNQFHSSPKGGALDAWLDSVLVLSPWFCHKIGFSFLQSSPLCCLLLLGELPSHLLTDNLLQDKKEQKSIVTLGWRSVSAMAHSTPDPTKMVSILINIKTFFLIITMMWQASFQFKWCKADSIC